MEFTKEEEEILKKIFEIYKKGVLLLGCHDPECRAINRFDNSKCYACGRKLIKDENEITMPVKERENE